MPSQNPSVRYAAAHSLLFLYIRLNQVTNFFRLPSFGKHVPSLLKHGGRAVVQKGSELLQGLGTEVNLHIFFLYAMYIYGATRLARLRELP